MKISNQPSINFKANKIYKPQAEYIDKVLKNSNDVAIICHDDTDRDSAYSAVSIYDYLKQKGINSKIIISQDLKNLNLENRDCNFIQSKEINESIASPDTVLCVDFSSDERVNKETLDFMKKAKNVLCIDHHSGFNLVDHDYTYINKPLDENSHKNSVTSFYIDASAKSNTSILYRFYEALGEKIDNSQAYSLFSGLVSDGQKRGLLSCDGKTGTIEEHELLYDDTNSYEIYSKLRNNLTYQQIKQITREVDITSELTEDEEQFQNSLIDRINYENDGKLAYIIIPIGDEGWDKIGQDNSKSSAILNKFRRDILNNKFHDEKLEDVKTIMIFYQGENKYKVSFHSKVNLQTMYELYNSKYKNSITSLGGHSKRGGGRVVSTDSKVCEKWVNSVIDCAKQSIL